MYVIKLPANLFDMATAFLIFAFIRKHLAFKTAILATALYVFNPAVIYNAAVWGQFDAIYTFFLVLSLYLMLDSKPKWAVVAFMIGVLTKPQSIALLPLMVFLVLRKNSWRGLLTSILVSAATVFIVILPFEWSNPITFLSRIYFGAYGNYGFTSVNAFNLWAFGGLWQPDTQLTFLLGWVLFASLAAITLYFVNKRYEISPRLSVVFAAFMLFFGFFMLPTRIHERYLFPALSMLALMFPFLKKTWLLYASLTATCFVNQAYVLHWLNVYANAGYSYGPNLSGDPVVLIVSLINLGTFVYALMLMIGELKGRVWLKSAPTKSKPISPIVPRGENEDAAEQ
jgi:Gpi18-like mannosyltransferase